VPTGGCQSEHAEELHSDGREPSAVAPARSRSACPTSISPFTRGFRSGEAKPHRRPRACQGPPTLPGSGSPSDGPTGHSYRHNGIAPAMLASATSGLVGAGRSCGVPTAHSARCRPWFQDRGELRLGTRAGAAASHVTVRGDARGCGRRVRAGARAQAGTREGDAFEGLGCGPVGQGGV
jgi:hypothetical protein